MSLVGWLQLNGNVTNKGLDNFTVSGTPAYNSNGKLSSQSLSLGNRVTFTVPSLANAKTFSIAFWVLINADSSKTTDWVDVLAMVSRNSADSAGSQFRWETCYGSSKDSVGLGAYEGGSTAYVGASNANTLTATKGVWMHVAAVADKANNIVRWYLDGVQKVTRTHGDGFLTGAGWIGENNAINGSIQDVRFYNHALSVKEVKELAKGLCLHIPLDWGGNPNMIGNSYTWMNKAVGVANTPNPTPVYTRSAVEDDTAPCHWVYKCQIQNTSTTAISGGAGVFYSYSLQGFALTDLVEGETYTYSFWAKSDSGIVNGFAPNSVGEGQTVVSSSGFGSLDSTWRKHTRTFKWSRTNSLTLCFYVSVPASSTVDFQICGLKLEKGDKATPYIPKSTETAYTSYGYATKAFEDVSGYNRNATNTGCINGGDSIRGLSCTYRATANRIALPAIYSNNTQLHNFSTSIWFKINTLNNTAPQLWNLGQNSFWRARIQSATGIWYYINMGSSNTYKSATITVPSSTIDNNWHNCVITFSNGIVKLYYDGIIKSTNDYSSTATFLNVYSQNWYLGDHSANQEALDGCLSDFRIYASTLTDDDIKALYQTGASIAKNGAFMTGQLVEE